MVPQDAPLASELVLDVLGKRGQTRTRPRRRSEAVSSAGGDRGDGASPLQRHRIEEVVLVVEVVDVVELVDVTTPEPAPQFGLPPIGLHCDLSFVVLQFLPATQPTHL